MRQFGLIGYPLGHSFSEKYFSDKFEKEGITDCAFGTFSLPSIKDLPALLQQYPTMRGLNVTIPYKEQVLAYLDYKDPVVEKIGACNCIKIKDGKLHGYNTDVKGFRESLQQKLRPIHTKALILGTGGAAKAVAYALKQLQIEYLYVSRTAKDAVDHVITYSAVTPDILDAHPLIINATPVGMSPDENSAPPIKYDYLTPRHYLFDLIYNPAHTLFLQKGEEQGAIIQNGYDMLIIQADESWEIWNS